MKLIKKLEILFLFIIIPVTLSNNKIAIVIKVSAVVLAITYIALISYQHRKQIFKKRIQKKPKRFWTIVCINLLIIFVSSYFYIQNKNPELLFKSVLEQPWVWIKFLLIYTFISVVPQEYIYRIFFFYRYKKLSKNTQLLYLANALLFSLAHLFFQNTYVFVFTFLGGYLFSYTYHKTKSWIWVSIEHAIYGGWIFTLGLGKILGFPI